MDITLLMVLLFKLLTELLLVSQFVAKLFHNK